MRWAMRRSAGANAGGRRAEALAILNAAAVSFRDNAEAVQLLAGGYVAEGFAPFAVELFRREALEDSGVDAQVSAVEAALAAQDTKAARRLAQAAIAQHPADPELLLLAARVEEARGDFRRAAGYYRDALVAAPDPGPQVATRTPAAVQPGDLQRLLAPGADSRSLPSASGKPYLPSYPPGSAPVPLLKPEGVPAAAPQ